MGVIVTRKSDVNNTVISAGYVYFYDKTRSKWLSVEKYQIDFSINHRNVSSNRWLALSTGIYSNNVGWFIERQGTIINITFQSKKLTTCEAEIISNGNPVVAVQLNNQKSKSVNVNVDFVSDSVLQGFLKPNLKIDYPLVKLTYAFRI